MRVKILRRKHFRYESFNSVEDCDCSDAPQLAPPCLFAMTSFQLPCYIYTIFNAAALLPDLLNFLRSGGFNYFIHRKFDESEIDVVHDKYSIWLVLF